MDKQTAASQEELEMLELQNKLKDCATLMRFWVRDPRTAMQLMGPCVYLSSATGQGMRVVQFRDARIFANQGLKGFIVHSTTEMLVPEIISAGIQKKLSSKRMHARTWSRTMLCIAGMLSHMLGHEA